MSDQREKEVEALSRQRSPGLVKEFLQFVVENKAWWMLPILIVLGMLGVFASLSYTGAAPFIYSLF